MPARCASDLIAGSLISLVTRLWFGNSWQLQRGVEHLLQLPPVALPTDRERRHQGLGGLAGPSAAQLDGVLLGDYNIIGLARRLHEALEILRGIGVMVLIRQQL